MITIKDKTYRDKEVLPTVGVCIMVKNEENNIIKTLVSSSHIADQYIILDTGSTDNTISVIRDTCTELQKPLSLKQTEFKNFSVSRNEMLDFANKSHVDYLVLLDSNEEVKMGEKLKEYLHKNSKNDLFYVCVYYLEKGKVSKHKISRLMKNNDKCRYIYPVHECLLPKTGENVFYGEILDNVIYYYQNREINDYINLKRYNRDVDILLKEYENNSKDTHVLYYLAQSYYLLHNYNKAIIYYQKRIDLDENDTPNDEVLDSLTKIGRCHVYKDRNWKEAFKYMWSAYEYGKYTIEPLLFISEHFFNTQRFTDAYYILKIACKSEYPNHLSLNVSKKAYEFNRYEMMSRASEAMGKYKICNNCCEKCLKYLYQNGNHPNRETVMDELLKRYEKNKELMFQRVYQTYSSNPLILIFGGWEYSYWNGFSVNEKGGLGGSETSVVLLAEEFQRRGYKVVICCNTKERIVCRDVEYIRILDYEPFLREYVVDHLIVNSNLTALRYYPNIKNVYIWSQEQNNILPSISSSFNIDDSKLKGIVSASKWHEKYIKDIVLPHFQHIVKYIGNSILPSRFSDYSSINKKTLRFIYSSCPTRGLVKLIPLFRKIKKLYPQSTLEIFSNFDLQRVKKKINVRKLKHDINITNGATIRGRISQKELAKEMMLSDYWIYLSDIPDTCCISALEAQASGCICIYLPIGSLPEVIGERGIKLDSKDDEEILDAISYLEDNPDIKEDMRNDARKWAIQQSYKDSALNWIELFRGEKDLNIYI